MATAALDGSMHIYDVTTNMLQWTCTHGVGCAVFDTPAHNNVMQAGVVALRWHPSLSFIITGSLDGSVRIWDSRSGTCAVVRACSWTS